MSQSAFLFFLFDKNSPKIVYYLLVCSFCSKMAYNYCISEPHQSKTRNLLSRVSVISLICGELPPIPLISPPLYPVK